MQHFDTQLSKQHCPYCGEPIHLIIDASVDEQEYIEDCEVCCRPMNINVSVDTFGNGESSVNIKTLEE